MSGEWRVEIRAATDEECREHAPDHANTVDGAAAVVVSGKLIAITNEYGTPMLASGVPDVMDDNYGNAVATAGQVEELVEVVTALIAATGDQ